MVIEAGTMLMIANYGWTLSFFTFLSNLGEVMSHLTIIILLIFMSTGWGIRNHADPPIDTLLPIMMLVIIVQFITTIVASSIEEAHYTFTDYDGTPGILVIVMRFGLMIWFHFSINVNFKLNKEKLVDKFVMNLGILGTIYILAFPAVIVGSWFFENYIRNKIIVIGGVLIQNITFNILGKTFGEKGTYFMISNKSKHELPGKIN